MPLKWSVIFLQSPTSTGYFSNSTGSSVTNCRFSPIIGPTSTEGRFISQTELCVACIISKSTMKKHRQNLDGWLDGRTSFDFVMVSVNASSLFIPYLHYIWHESSQSRFTVDCGVVYENLEASSNSLLNMCLFMVFVVWSSPCHTPLKYGCLIRKVMAK